MLTDQINGLLSDDPGRLFAINSFHVLLSALWLCHDPEQVETEVWTVAGRRFSAFIGSVGTRSSASVTPSIPAGMMTLLEAAIRMVLRELADEAQSPV